MTITIKNVTSYLPEQQWNTQTDLVVQTCYETLEKPSSHIDGSQQWIIPGIVDLQNAPCPAHQLYPKQAIAQELSAAFKRGFCQIVVPPHINTSHQPETPLGVFRLGALAGMKAGSLQLNDLNALAESGCIAFLIDSSMCTNLQTIRQFYTYAASFDFKIVIKANEPSLTANGIINEGIVSEMTGMRGIPAIGEAIAIAQQLLLIEDTGIKAHFSGITTARSVDLIKKARESGLPVTADTIMSHLHLTEVDCADFNPHCHVYPPLRTETDRLALLKGLEDGVIDAICSYHVPLSTEDKAAPFADSIPGMSGIDTFLSLGLKLVMRKELSLKTLINAISKHPRTIFSLPESRTVLHIDPNAEWLPAGKYFLSKGHNSPFKDFPLPGKITGIYAV